MCHTQKCLVAPRKGLHFCIRSVKSLVVSDSILLSCITCVEEILWYPWASWALASPVQFSNYAWVKINWSLWLYLFALPLVAVKFQTFLRRTRCGETSWNPNFIFELPMCINFVIYMFKAYIYIYRFKSWLGRCMCLAFWIENNLNIDLPLGVYLRCRMNGSP